MARTIASPTVNAQTQAFWDAARRGRLAIPFCAACGKAHWYPRAVCPFCAGVQVEWRDASGKGTIYAYSVMRRAAEPYVIAYVTLAEGPTMLTNIVDCDVDKVRIGQSVSVVFKHSDNGQPVPMFRPQ
jgi:uncharacterized OB-fold protein